MLSGVLDWREVVPEDWKVVDDISGGTVVSSGLADCGKVVQMVVQQSKPLQQLGIDTIPYKWDYQPLMAVMV